MELKEYLCNKEISFNYTLYNIRIVNSYKVNNLETMKEILKMALENDPYRKARTRSSVSYLREWYAHNLFSKINIDSIQERAMHCDLNENESKIRLFIYNIIGIIKGIK